mmetsp:Transcript_30777/g.55858  ORF Transcript_30777/g.55858 Transcript_30777/m.55858 type:complete len:398 (+) Transcript_30777:70-1263(+)
MAGEPQSSVPDGRERVRLEMQASMARRTQNAQTSQAAHPAVRAALVMATAASGVDPMESLSVHATRLEAAAKSSSEEDLRLVALEVARDLRKLRGSTASQAEAPTTVAREVIPSKTLTGHQDVVRCVVVVGEHIVSGSDDKALKVWEIASGKCKATLQGHTSDVCCLAGLDDQRVISASKDKSLKVWDLAEMRCMTSYAGHKRHVTSVAVLSPDRFVSGALDRSVKVWSVESDKSTATLEGHQDAITCVAAISPDRAASGSADKTIRIWDVAENICLQTLEGHSHHVLGLTVVSDGRIASASKDKTLRLWDMTGACLQKWEQKAFVQCVTELNPGCLVSGSSDKSLKVWSLANGHCTATLEGHSDTVLCVSTGLPNYIVSGSDDCTIKIWSMEKPSV